MLWKPFSAVVVEYALLFYIGSIFGYAYISDKPSLNTRQIMNNNKCNIFCFFNFRIFLND